MTDYTQVLETIYGGAQWSLDGNEYSGLDWFDDSPKPTQAELEAAWPQVEHDLEVARIKAEREARYRTETDPMFFRYQRNEDGVTLADWQAAVQQIRDDLPYPQAPA